VGPVVLGEVVELVPLEAQEAAVRKRSLIARLLATTKVYRDQADLRCPRVCSVRQLDLAVVAVVESKLTLAPTPPISRERMVEAAAVVEGLDTTDRRRKVTVGHRCSMRKTTAAVVVVRESPVARVH
jgi:hypothetical protein